MTRIEECFKEGMSAYWRGVMVNPYYTPGRSQSSDAIAWDDGWWAAEDDDFHRDLDHDDLS